MLDREEQFKKWLRTPKPQGHGITSNTPLYTYPRALNAVNRQFINVDRNIFNYTDIVEYEKIERVIRGSSNFSEANQGGALSAALSAYRSFLSSEVSIEPETVLSDQSDKTDRNLLIFGAPGTGKSYRLDQTSKQFDGSVNRVTFYPDYSYGQFVGTYKPKPDGNGGITYRYTPGPFLNLLITAHQEPDKYHLLIIEELNRANAAAVFGDMFQLLDRSADGDSQYSIDCGEDLRDYLVDISFWGTEDLTAQQQDASFGKLSIPRNMYIWATMNTADQGVMPLDTAFKRRWSFHYMPLDEGEQSGLEFTVTRKTYDWNAVRQVINTYLSQELAVNEDKLMGAWFINHNQYQDRELDIKTIQSKVLMYLFDDVVKTKRDKLFSGDRVVVNRNSYADICAKFETSCMQIFVPKLATDLEALVKSIAQDTTDAS